MIGPSLMWAFTAGKVRHHVKARIEATRAALVIDEQMVLEAFGECEDALAALANDGERLAARTTP